MYEAFHSYIQLLTFLFLDCTLEGSSKVSSPIPSIALESCG